MKRLFGSIISIGAIMLVAVATNVSPASAVELDADFTPTALHLDFTHTAEAPEEDSDFDSNDDGLFLTTVCFSTYRFTSHFSANDRLSSTLRTLTLPPPESCIA